MKNIYRLPRREYTPRNDGDVGFTLIELLVAMGIIAVLTGLAIFNFNQSRVRARDVQRKNDLKQLQNALELYKNDNNVYPAGNATVMQSTLLSPVAYIKALFVDPRASDWADYKYVPSADRKTYYLQACLENTADASKATNTAICQLFTSDSTNICKCGPASNKIGNMYIVSQP